MKQVFIIFAEGFEEIEGLTAADLLRRAQIRVKLLGLDTEEIVTGAHGIGVRMDGSLKDLKLDEAEAILLPGGMPGTRYLKESSLLADILRKADEKKIRLGAICAAPSVLGNLGLLIGRRAVCYPGFEEQLSGARVLEESVVTDGHITTSRGMGTAIDFGLELIRLLKDGEEAERIKDSVIYNRQETGGDGNVVQK